MTDDTADNAEVQGEHAVQADQIRARIRADLAADAEAGRISPGALPQLLLNLAAHTDADLIRWFSR